MLSAIRKTQPTVEPVSLSEAKTNMRIPDGQTIDDNLINSYISAAREQAEQFIDRPICRAEYMLVYDIVKGTSFRLKYPASQVISVTYHNSEHETITPSFTYDQDLNLLVFDEYIDGKNLKVSITSGINHGFPESIKQAILMLVTDFYTGRASAEYSNKAAEMLLMPFKNRPIL